MNNRDMKDISGFYKFYADSSARFLKTSYLLDPNDRSKNLAEESLNMGREEYVTYIGNILNGLDEYAYRLTINGIKPIDGSDSILVSYGVEEYSLRKGQEVVDPNTNQKVQKNDVSFVSTNCNMSIGTATGDPVILSTNCIEKIIKIQ